MFAARIKWHSCTCLRLVGFHSPVGRLETKTEGHLSIAYGGVTFRFDYRLNELPDTIG